MIGFVILFLHVLVSPFKTQQLEARSRSAAAPVPVEYYIRHMWSGPAGKCFFRRLISGNGAVICSACFARSRTAGLDEIRDASGPSVFRALSALPDRPLSRRDFVPWVHRLCWHLASGRLRAGQPILIVNARKFLCVAPIRRSPDSSPRLSDKFRP